MVAVANIASRLWFMRIKQPELRSLGFERYRKDDFLPTNRGANGRCNALRCHKPAVFQLRKETHRKGVSSFIKAYCIDHALAYARRNT